MQNQSFFNYTGGRNSLSQLQSKIILTISIIAVILHSYIWLQVFIQKIKIDRSFIYPLGYISTDIFLLIFYFVQYSIRVRSWIPITTSFCHFEAYGMFVFNLYENYPLAALNICRYWQIVRNRNVYQVHRQKLYFISALVLSLFSMNFIVQHVFGWCIVTETSGESCTLTYTNVIVKIWNILIVLTVPIVISFVMLYRALHFLQSVQAQQRVVHRNHHHNLLLHTAIFYSIWLSLWFPLMVVIFLNVNQVNQWIVFAAAVGNTMEICIDPVITFFLDKRFAQIWKRSYRWIIRHFISHVNTRVQPVSELIAVPQTNINLPSRR